MRNLPTKSHLTRRRKAPPWGLTLLLLLVCSSATFAQARAAPVRWPCLPPGYQPSYTDLVKLAQEAADRNGLNRNLFLQLVTVESSWNPCAVSPKGARGLTQLMPATARRFGVRDAHDPAQNLNGGARYLRWLLDFFGGDADLAVAGYNAGENSVIRYGWRVPPYAETRQYVTKVNSVLYRRGQEARFTPTAQIRPRPQSTPASPAAASTQTPAAGAAPPEDIRQEPDVETKSAYLWNRKKN